jgi:hypothetical protein
MIAIVKLASLATVLSAGLMAAVPGPEAELPVTSAKLFQDRVPADAPASMPAPAASVRLADASGTLAGPSFDRTLKGDSRSRSAHPCNGQAWPYLSAECLNAGGAPARKVSRTIAIDSREGQAVSMITKASSAETAQR